MWGDIAVVGGSFMTTQNCDLKGCSGVLKYYNGALGYEAMVCERCGAHYTGGNDNGYTIWVDRKEYAKIKEV